MLGKKSLGLGQLQWVTPLLPSSSSMPPSPYQQTPEASRLAAPQAGSGQEEGIFCELQAWSLLMPISVSACLELQGQQASVILVARSSGLETLPDVGRKSESPRGGTWSLKGEEMGFHRSSTGPAASRAQLPGARKEEQRESSRPASSCPSWPLCEPGSGS